MRRVGGGFASRHRNDVAAFAVELRAANNRMAAMYSPFSRFRSLSLAFPSIAIHAFERDLSAV